jgi:hypothetical protein
VSPFPGHDGQPEEIAAVALFLASNDQLVSGIGLGCPTNNRRVGLIPPGPIERTLSSERRIWSAFDLRPRPR